MEFDDAVDALGAAVVGALGGEVGEEGVLPAAEGASEAGDLGDRAGGEGGEDLLGLSAAFIQVAAAVGGPEVLGAYPGDIDLVVGGIGFDGSGEAVELPVGEVLCPGA